MTIHERGSISPEHADMVGPVLLAGAVLDSIHDINPIIGRQTLNELRMRQRICLRSLLQERVCASDLAGELRMPAQTVSKYVGQLVVIGDVVAVRDDNDRRRYNLRYSDGALSRVSAWTHLCDQYLRDVPN